MKSLISCLALMGVVLLAAPSWASACEGCGCSGKAGADASAVFGADHEGGCPHAKAAGAGSCRCKAGGCPAAAAAEEGAPSAPAAECPCNKAGGCQCGQGGQCPYKAAAPQAPAAP